MYIMHYCCYSDGVSRSAMLCAAMATLEQTRSHAMVDVFQIVKKMRSQLLGAIRSWVCSNPTLLFLMTAPCAPSYWKEYSSSYYPLLTHASMLLSYLTGTISCHSFDSGRIRESVQYNCQLHATQEHLISTPDLYTSSLRAILNS